MALPAHKTQDSHEPSDVLARRRIGETSVLSPPLLERVSGVDEGALYPSGRVVPIRPGTPIQAPSLVATPTPKAPAAKEARKVKAALHPGPLSRLFARGVSYLPRPVAQAAMFTRNLFLGASLTFADESLSALTPVEFLWKNMAVVSQGLLYLSLPLVPSLALLYHVEPLGRAYAPNTLSGGLYLVGLYISCAVVMMASCLAARFLWQGAVRLSRRFARKGAQAFPVKGD